MTMTMTKAEWDELCFSVRDQMSEYVAPSVTPISRSDDMGRGFAWGTGSYMCLPSSETVLLTNEHVARKVLEEHLSHLPACGAYYELLPEFRVKPHPEDLAVCSIPSGRLGVKRRPLSTDTLDACFEPIDNEVLYWLGFPGTTASRHDAISENKTRYSWFGELQIVGMPMLTQQLQNWPEGLPQNFDSIYHTLVHYPAMAKRNPNEQEVELPNPVGLSGSLLWDTKAVACMRHGQTWNPSKARVCGVIWAAWDRPKVVVATKVQFLQAFITEVDSGGP